MGESRCGGICMSTSQITVTHKGNYGYNHNCPHVTYNVFQVFFKMCFPPYIVA